MAQTLAAWQALGRLPLYAGVECRTHGSPLAPIEGLDAYWCLTGAHAIPFNAAPGVPA